MKYNCKIGDIVEFRDWFTEGNLRKNMLLVETGVIIGSLQDNLHFDWKWKVQCFSDGRTVDVKREYITKLNEE